MAGGGRRPLKRQTPQEWRKSAGAWLWLLAIILAAYNWQFTVEIIVPGLGLMLLAGWLVKRDRPERYELTDAMREYGKGGRP